MTDGYTNKIRIKCWGCGKYLGYGKIDNKISSKKKFPDVNRIHYPRRFLKDVMLCFLCEDCMCGDDNG